jgi:putative membrane protein
MGVCSMIGGWSMMSGGWSMMLPGLFVTVAVWALLIWAGVRVYRTWDQGRTRAEDTLARRFATGEIDEDEYNRRLQTLRSTRDGAPWPSRA